MAENVCYSFFCAEDGGFVSFKICGSYLIFLVKSRSLWKMQPPYPPIPFMRLVWGQRLVLGLRNFSLGFTERSTNLPKKRKHFTARNQLKCLSALMYLFLRYHIWASRKVLYFSVLVIWPELNSLYFNICKIQLVLICSSFPIHNCALFSQGWKKSQHSIIAVPFISPALLLAQCADFPKIQLDSAPLMCISNRPFLCMQPEPCKHGHCRSSFNKLAVSTFKTFKR